MIAPLNQNSASVLPDAESDLPNCSPTVGRVATKSGLFPGLPAVCVSSADDSHFARGGDPLGSRPRAFSIQKFDVATRWIAALAVTASPLDLGRVASARAPFFEGQAYDRKNW